MKDIAVSIFTPLPAFADGLFNELRLFFNLTAYTVNDETVDGERLIQFYRENGTEAVTGFSFLGDSEEMRFLLPETDKGELIKKRIIKRNCCHTLYKLLSRITGIRPPWGSLTGVRPTRLFRQRLETGMSDEQIMADMVAAYDISPEKAKLLSRVVQEQDRLPVPQKDDIDIYISIPFCRTRCAYCSFPGEAIGKGACVPAYLDRLFEEMRQGQSLMKEAGLHLRALYIGGGTPSSLNEADFSRLLNEVTRLFPGGAEYTVEAGRPDTITRGKLQAMKDCGIGRVSINPQTMNDETLQAIGRCHTARDTQDAFALARSMGFDNINMDVIAALPGENLSHFAITTRQIKAMNPDSLTVHTLAIKRSSRLNLERFPLPEGSITADMIHMAEKAADDMGMEPYYLYRQKNMAGLQQNTGYARPGKACLYNVDIMEETMSILAFGAGAISKRVPPRKDALIERAPNVSDVKTYLERTDEMIQRKRTLFLKAEEEQL